VKLPWLLAGLTLISGCALNRPDHFYVLDSGNSRTLDPRTTFATQVALRVTLPILVDRSEMVLLNPAGVQILEHERWAAPLGEQIISVLGQDIEARREDVILASRRIAEPGLPNATISVDVVQLALRKSSGVRLEARWRLQDGRDGKVSQGRETFMAPAADANMPSLVRSINVCLGLLADRLVADLSH
jgi:uncharacterized lipoprotein YmbA